MGASFDDDGCLAVEILKRPIDFIPSDEFATTTEADFVWDDEELYVAEGQEVGSLDPDRVAASLLNSLQQSRLLTPEGEQNLFKQLNFLRFRASAIQATLHASRPAKKKVQELERLLAEADATRGELAKANLRLVVSIAGRLSASRDEFDEFVAEGNAIMLHAIDKFDYSRGFRFSTYATHAVQRHLYRVIGRRRKRAQREQLHEAERMAEEPTVEFALYEPSRDEIEAACSAVIAKIDEVLDEREKVVVRGRFGLDGTGEAKTFKVLGEQLGLSKERVRQLFQKGIEKLGEAVKSLESTFAPL